MRQIQKEKKIVESKVIQVRRARLVYRIYLVLYAHAHTVLEQLDASKRHARTFLQFHKAGERTCASCVNAMVFLRILKSFFCRGSTASNEKHPRRRDADIQRELREKYLSSNSFHMKVVRHSIYLCNCKKVKWHRILWQIVYLSP